jgi:hypothetical protein
MRVCCGVLGVVCAVVHVGSGCARSCARHTAPLNTPKPTHTYARTRAAPAAHQPPRPPPHTHPPPPAAHLDPVVCEHKLAHVGVEREAKHAVANGEHHGVARGVEAVAGGQQVAAGLAHVCDARLQRLVQVLAHEARLVGLVDAKDAAHGDAWLVGGGGWCWGVCVGGGGGGCDGAQPSAARPAVAQHAACDTQAAPHTERRERTRVDVAGAVQRVKHHDVVAAGRLLHSNRGGLLLARNHACGWVCVCDVWQGAAW